ncbi:MAG: peptidylprolyl isomerase [Syntrophales bacterium]|jgi:peptidylprolyl isomerase|nr:peptidylprolyl isomerase [Syntrophales bacterium]MDY0045768.1 peptidylprolyl isomerase [Syntrophales bacterium]
MSEAIKQGDTISVNYTGRFKEGGEVFDTSYGRDPLKFTVGKGQLIKGFDSAVIGMTQGEKKTFTVSPQEAYGEYREEMVFDIPLDRVPDDMELEEGMTIQLSDQQGNRIPAVVSDLGEDTVKMDANHPLAGKTLEFEVEVMETGLAPDIACFAGGCGNCSSC